MASPFDSGRNPPTPEPPKKITRQTRNNVLDWLALSGHQWAGRLTDDAFLSRIYDLSQMGSGDYRFKDAAGDIWQHRVNNYDWEDDWVLTDARFELRDGSDENLLRFLAETVHPVVRQDAQSAEYLVSAYNDTLRADGFELHETGRMGDRAIYGWRQIAAYRAPTASRLGKHPDLANRAVLHQQLDRIGRDLEADPASAIATSKNLLETLCKIVLTDLGVAYSDRDELPGLFASVAGALAINADSVPNDQRGSDAMKKAMRTLTTTVQAVAEARNSIGDGHGAAEVSPAEPRHSRLVYNATVAVAEFIVDTWKPSATS